MSSFAAKAKAKAVKAAAIAKAKANEVDAKHNIVAKTKSGARRASAKISAAADSAKTAVDGALTDEQQQNAVMGATLGLSALSMVGVPGAGAALTTIAVGGTAATLHSQQKAQGGNLTHEQMLGGAIGMGSAVGGAKTRLAMGAVNLGMQVNQNGGGGGGGGSSGGGGGGGGGMGGLMKQAKQAKQAADLGKKMGLTPQQALKGAKMAKKTGLI